MHGSAQQAAALLRTLLHASDFMLSTSYTPHAWGLKPVVASCRTRSFIHPTRVGSESLPSPQKPSWPIHPTRVGSEITPYAVSIPSSSLPHTRGVTGGDAAQGGKIRPYAVGCQDFGLGCTCPTRVGYTMQCMVLRSRLRLYFGLYFTLRTSCFLLRIPTRVGYTMQCMVLRSRLRRYFGLSFILPTSHFRLRIPTRVG
jgi:hypothetical protein